MDPFFLGGNFVRAPQALLLLTIISASSMAGKIVLANSRSCAVYLGSVPLTGFAFGSRSMKSSIMSVA